MKIKMTIEVDLEDYVFDPTEDESVDWFEKEVLSGNGTLLLHSNEIGDTIGVINSVENIQYEPKK